METLEGHFGNSELYTEFDRSTDDIIVTKCKNVKMKNVGISDLRSN